jgi:uncharacterized repeat protein (TIGR01451 family)
MRALRHLSIAGVLAGVLALSSAPVLAAGGSYATSGTGTFAQSLWWLDFTGFSTASTATQNLTFTLPSGAGTLTLGATISSTGMQLVAEPSWPGGGAFGHGAYNGVGGKPIFYWLNQVGTASTTLSTISVKDASGNARSFVFYAADGENTNNPETITYLSTASWALIDTVNYYAAFNGGVLTLAGTGTTSVVETAPAANDRNYNASVVLGTSNPTQVSSTYSGNEATLFALSLPPVTFNLSIPSGRVSASDQFTASIAYSSPATTIKSVTTSSGATSATTGATSVIGTNNITLSAVMAAGSFSALATYTGSMSCSNSGPGASAWGGANTVLPSGAGTTFTLTPQTGDNISCTLTLTPPPQTVTGTVYNDANHNGALDAGESGTGISGLYVKLAPDSGGTCQSPATGAAAVGAASGAYTLPGVPAGNYCLILSGNNTLSDVSPALPAGWIGTQNAAGVIHLTVIASGPPPPQNFGLFSGSKVSGVVFADTGAGAGVANNGVQDGAEPGIANVTVQASGGAVTASGVTASNGAYTLWIPASASGAFTLDPTAPSGYLATGGSAGTTGGSYTRPSVTFTPSSGQTYSGVSFGLVPANTFGPSGAQTAQPGTTLFYAHAFLAGSAGTVTLSVSSSDSPAAPAWNQVLYQDSNCNGVLDSGEPQVSGALAVSAGQKICLILKVLVPAGAVPGAQSSATLSAAFSYSNASPALAATVTASDVTTLASPGALALTKVVSDLTTGSAAATADSANPGDTLQYTLTATNNGAQPLSTLVISDATPSYTTFVSAACPATLPAGITSCNVTAQPAVGASGAVQWTFAGSLAASASLTVTYQVKIGG